MATVIRPYTEDWVPAVKAFNRRLLQAGAALSFPDSHVPKWLPKVNGCQLYHEYYLATEDDAVRGAYILKYQPFLVGGQVVSLAQFRLPISEGQIDKQFASLGAQLYLDALRKHPHLFTIGIGGYHETFAKLLISAGWSTCAVPFYFRVLRPARFLRNIVYLRTSLPRRLALDAMAASGLGTLAVHAYQYLRTRKQPKDTSQFAYSEVPAFAAWADDVWQVAQGGYSLIAVRNAEILNLLYPASDPRWTRLKVTAGDRVVGWAVLLNIPMQGHNYFGNMRVGSLVDCLAVGGMESKVTRAAMDYLKRHDSDIVVTNQSHMQWCSALEAAGLYQGPSNFIFAASKKVSAVLQPFEEQKDRVHMTRGDGSGPENLLAASHPIW